MKIQISKMDTSRGAPMGRHSSVNLSGKCKLQPLPMYDGAYDRGGAYWGIGETMWVCEDSEGSQMFVRARSRELAKAQVRLANNDEEITFYR